MTENSVADDEADVRTVIANWMAAVRARDINAILANHSDNLVMFDVPPPFENVGLDAYRKSWELFFSWSGGQVRFDVQKMTVVAGREVAFAFAKMGCFGPDAEGKPQPLDFRLTIGLKKVAGRWLIVHEHHSVPAED
jgi:uncharacterized protein (TIGR02246 family)